MSSELLPTAGSEDSDLTMRVFGASSGAVSKKVPSKVVRAVSSAVFSGKLSTAGNENWKLTRFGCSTADLVGGESATGELDLEQSSPMILPKPKSKAVSGDAEDWELEGSQDPVSLEYNSCIKLVDSSVVAVEIVARWVCL